jgi:hypothetical protein
MRANSIVNYIHGEGIDADLKSKVQEFTKLLARPNVSQTEAESFRFTIHKLADQKGYTHSGSWHEDVRMEYFHVPGSHFGLK